MIDYVNSGYKIVSHSERTWEESGQDHILHRKTAVNFVLQKDNSVIMCAQMHDQELKTFVGSIRLSCNELVAPYDLRKP